jgi:hypothetical protein
MEKQFPRAGKTKGGGTKVTLTDFISWGASPAGNAALRNPIPGLKKEQQKNPVATLEKNPFDFCGQCFSKLASLMARRNRSAGQKDSHNTDDIGFLRPPRNTTQLASEIDASVTTSHLFWPNERRRAAFLLPFSRPNSDFLGSDCNEKAPWGGGGRPTHPLGKYLIDHLTRNFMPNGQHKKSSPLSFPARNRQ